MTITNNAYEHKLKGCVRIAKMTVMYFRYCSRANMAKKMFITAIEEDKELHAELQKAGFSFDNEIFKPKQITVIVNRWGYPDDFLINSCRNEKPTGKSNA